MRSAAVCLFAAFAVVALSSAGCSRRSKKHKKEPLQITTTSLPVGYEGQTGYSTTLTATGGTGTYTWSMTSGTLPANLSWDATSATISGDIATGTAGDYPLQFEVTDGIQTVTADLTLTVHTQLRITTTSLPDATEQSAYSCTIQATGGNSGNYTWSISGQPSWLSIDAATGELSGTPPAGSAGTFTFTVEVTDGLQTVSKQFVLVVNTPAPPEADFEANSTYGTAPLTVNFTDKSTGTITQWQWDFDNNGTVDSSDQNPTYTYNSPGWHTVKLTVSDGTNSDTCVKEMFILVANNIWYVNGNGGDDANGGTGWSDAWKTIGKALSQAGDYDLVLVADATYNETDLKFNGRKIYLRGVAHNTSGAQPVIDCQRGGRAFYFGSGETKDSVIDNFTIKNGSTDRGCAIFCDSSSPTVVNCTFGSNRAGYYGGAIYCSSSNPTITHCTFSNNRANWDGGAIECRNSSSPTLTNCTFSRNSAGLFGGAICCESGDPTITHCTFGDNCANCDGGAVCCYSSSPTLTNCTFIRNGAKGSGGALYCTDSSPRVVNCIFNLNSATDDGGVICCYNSNSADITNCTFSDNSAGDYGGAIYCNQSTPTLNNCILWNNSAISGGDEIYISDSGSSCTLSYCCADNTGYGGQTGNITEKNCIHQDPQFVDAANGDYHLKGTSPCVDAGDNSFVPSRGSEDLDGKQRIVDGDNDGTATVDIGAYEYQMQITTTTLPDAVEGVAYSYTVQATGGNSANYTWSISRQPSWLAIDAATGELRGTPPAGSAGNTYTFTVSVTDGQQMVSKQFVLVVRLLFADFEASPTQGKAPLTVNFTDKSKGNITQWQWDFDNDGTIDSIQQNPTHTYNNPGWYTVKLTVTGPAGSDTCVKEMYILVGANVYYVDGVGGDDANGGTGWGDAWKTIGKALSVARDYDLVLVADATYNETDLNFNGKKICLKGVDHNTAGQRPVIDCQQAGRAFYFGSGETKDCVVDSFTIKHGSADRGGAIFCDSSSPTVVNCTFSGNGANSDGGAVCCYSSSPTITNCVFKNNAAHWGGAVSCKGNSSPMIVGCTFRHNSASHSGGAIECRSHSSPTITDCTFIVNSSSESGGAIFCEDSSSPTIINCAFSSNSADSGGATYCCDSSSPSLTNCTFNGNSAHKNGGAIFCDSSSADITNCTFSDNSAAGSGGAVYCDSSSPTVSDCAFSDNSASGNGGALFCIYSSSPTVSNCAFSGNSAYDSGGAIFCLSSSSPMIIDCTFSNNSSRNGGAVYCRDSTPSITNCTFSGNSADSGGGAIFCWSSSSPPVSNCTFSGNSAGGGGAIFCQQNCSPPITNCVFSGNTAMWFRGGGAIFCHESSNPTVTNCTFSDNSATNAKGGAIYCDHSSNPTLNNCILWGNSAVTSGSEVYIDDSGSSCTLNHCCVDNTGYGFGSGVPATAIDDSNNCIFADPQFVDAAGGDYHLKDASACIDAGNNSYVPSGVTTDLDGNQRIVDGDNNGTATVDIGAYEKQ